MLLPKIVLIFSVVFVVWTTNVESAANLQRREAPTDEHDAVQKTLEKFQQTIQNTLNQAKNTFNQIKDSELMQNVTKILEQVEQDIQAKTKEFWEGMQNTTNPDEAPAKQ